ncbi:hypothetical protein HHL23_09350 [Chryseobacterium sp. RP-3-3]|uniref:Uncharacterized protein n=1 Tax=Chryseobacterium antibioticum TaxID=2728847 RepID=A0A7Y0FRS2_9FLAO|nr:hypothetical protein [Chryseobacterium antibioticum]NML70005.1 hypothetical protein [Chryseobacterium antibioticum]
MENRNYLNGKQYPYGYREWIWKVCIEYGFKDKDINTAYKQLDTDAFLCYFMEGLSPVEAVREDSSYA